MSTMYIKAQIYGESCFIERTTSDKDKKTLSYAQKSIRVVCVYCSSDFFSTFMVKL